MAWVKLDNTFADNPKVVAAGHEAGWLFIAGLCYASRHLTDGKVPAGTLGRLTDLPKPERHAERLVSVGLWEVVDGGWRVVNYDRYQRTRSEVDADRDRWRTKKRRQRATMSPDMSPGDIAECPPGTIASVPPGVPLSDTDTDTDTDTELSTSSVNSRVTRHALGDDEIIAIAGTAGLNRHEAVDEWARMVAFIADNRIDVTNLGGYWRHWCDNAARKELA